MSEQLNEEKKRLITGLIFATAFVLLMWIVKLAEITLGTDYSDFGIYPRTLFGLIGILTTPFLHADLTHLFNNSVPVFLSIIGIFYFFRKYAVDIITFSFLSTGFLIWLFARDSYIIGASGMAYTWLSFLFFGGLLSHNKNLMALSLIIIFVYGSLFWGLLPVKNNISWESHLMGAMNGLAFAFLYRKSAFIDPKQVIEEEDEDEENEEVIENANPPTPENESYWKYTNSTGKENESIDYK